MLPVKKAPKLRVDRGPRERALVGGEQGPLEQIARADDHIVAGGAQREGEVAPENAARLRLHARLQAVLAQLIKVAAVRADEMVLEQEQRLRIPEVLRSRHHGVGEAASGCKFADGGIDGGGEFVHGDVVPESAPYAGSVPDPHRHGTSPVRWG